MKPIFFFFVLFFQLSAQAFQGTQEKIQRYKPFIDSLSLVYGIPSKLIIGVGICESGFGQSKQSIKQNNYFGLRGKYVRKKKSSFKHYARPEDSMVDFCEVLASKKYYTNLKGNPDPMKWTRAMAKARYAANAKRWIRLMKKSFTLID
ncbi:glucosaminidase domain-containing protein [Aquirufa lenticrescens]|jgi:flagellum-specific peptidoglycan hydrolase FlgJ|uniref:glucosaminidase domain-containing protein n=1 Tax=Aquirufa lenticrescens TaxID=2696560 RepID=UPI001CAA597E|nr:glucosaminidase domain-containing protein [Aquirufa lenticrescens]UAJ14620.1 glucosaminidase domain-containing protein [Aquirufa lenticrescens]